MHMHIMVGWLQVTLGELMSVFGVCTMLSEGVLVRIMVPQFGEKVAMQIGACVYTYAYICMEHGPTIPPTSPTHPQEHTHTHHRPSHTYTTHLPKPPQHHQA